MRLKHVNVRVLLSSLLAVFAIGAVASASASASEGTHDFYVEGKAVGTAVSTAATRGATKFTYEGGKEKFTVKCTGGASTGTLEASGVSTDNGSATSCHIFIGASESEATACKISGAGIAGKGTLTGSGRWTEDDITPLYGPEAVLGNFTIEKGCSLEVGQHLFERGSLTCVLPEAGTEALLHRIKCEASSGITEGGNPATIVTEETVALSGSSAGKRWSANREYERETEHGFLEEGKAVTSAIGVAGTRGATTLAGTMFETSIKIKCTGGSTTGSLDGNTLSATEASLTGCKLFALEGGKETEQAGCEVGAIDLVSSDRLGDYGFALGAELFPASGVFADFAIKSGKCAYKKLENKLEGAFACALPSIGTEKVEHELACGPSEGELAVKLDGNAATIEGAETLKLTGTLAGKQWSAK